MKELFDKISLKNRVSGTTEEASIFRGLDANNLVHVETRWRPIFELRRIEAKASAQTMSQINAEDSHWQWGVKAIKAIRDPFMFDIFALEANNSTQGLMLLRKGGDECISRHNEHPRAQIVYVDLLATAPWNRPILVDEPVYKGVGGALLVAAITVSREQGLHGCIGLHSLKEAESFYRDVVQMTDLGIEQEGDHKGLRYFELPKSQATSFASDQH